MGAATAPDKKRPYAIAYGSMEQATGIEPAYSAWEADTLPLSYACIIPGRRNILYYLKFDLSTVFFRVTYKF